MTWLLLDPIVCNRAIFSFFHKNDHTHNLIFKCFQDDSSSQTSIRDFKEEDLHFQVAYELNDEENETVCYDCDK